MNPAHSDRQLFVLLGGTAVGKSDVAVPLALRLNAEIVCVDSMQVYRGMDIGTAKPPPNLRRRVPHHLLDLVDPCDSYDVSRFGAAAESVLDDLDARGRRALLVAGTPLYLMRLLHGMFAGPSADPALRQRLRRRAADEGTAALHAELARVDPRAAERIHPNDLRRIERGLEVWLRTGIPISHLQRQWEGQPRHPFRAVGLRRAREDQSRRINARVRRMISDGLIDEVRRLRAGPGGLSEPAQQAVGYAEIIAHLEGRLSLDDAIERIKINTRRLAKHQRTWFRRIPGIEWMDAAPDDDSADLAARCAERLAGIA